MSFAKARTEEPLLRLSPALPRAPQPRKVVVTRLVASNRTSPCLSPGLRPRPARTARKRVHSYTRHHSARLPVGPLGLLRRSTCRGPSGRRSNNHAAGGW